MKSKKPIFITVLIINILAFFSLAFAPVSYATDDVCNSNATQVVKDAAGCNGNNNALPGIIINILNGIIAVSGLIAVIFIVVGGINYMTSAGEASKIEKAKKTILYSVIGLAICALSFAIVNYVIKNIIG
ncbi:hypothetical protein IJG22_01260 [Candidatus Saccharibacteria bacterium]|nr:hypothetical protein [Candidatus Saccharibacteria bacterium]